MATQDLKRYIKNSKGTGWFRPFLNTPGFRFMVLHRLCNEYRSLHPFGLFARIWHKNLRVKFGFQIPHATSIGPGLFLGHYGSIVINQNSKIGRNCNIAQGVTIGQVNRGEKQGCPTLGDCVWIGANAVIVGNIRVGNNVLIAPLAYINFDIPDNAVALGNPAKIVSYTGSVGYINNKVDE